MEVSPNALRKETVQLLNQINKELATTTEKTLLIPLLLAKSQCLQTLTQLNEQGRRQ
jgi:hypothetical protein